MKTKNAKLLLLLLSATMLMQPAARSEFTLGDILGMAWKIGEIVVGTKTLTPAYALDTWHHHFTEPGYSATQKVRRARVTGQYFFYTKYHTPSTPVTEHTEAFPVNTVNKLNLKCGLSTTTETHSEFVWLAKVESTGLWPDNGPWTVWLKTSGNKTSCNPTNVVALGFWVKASVSQSGGETVSLGNPNCDLNYPFYLASDYYR